MSVDPSSAELRISALEHDLRDIREQLRLALRAADRADTALQRIADESADATAREIARDALGAE